MPADSHNSPEAELAAALRERRSLIADEASRRNPEGHLDKLKVISEKIVALGEALPRPLDPQLAHYLARCSYDKALEALEDVLAGNMPPYNPTIPSASTTRRSTAR